GGRRDGHVTGVQTCALPISCARELAEYLRDQRVPPAAAATFRELGGTVRDQLGVDASSFAQAATAARYGPPDGARQAAGSARERSEERRVGKECRARVRPER